MEVGKAEIWDEKELPEEIVKGLECGMQVLRLPALRMAQWLST